MTLYAIMLVFMLAGFIQGASGFGFALMALPVLCLMIPITEASPMLVLTGLTINGYLFWRLRAHFRMDRMRALMIGCLAGVPLGVWALAQVEARVLQVSLGVVLLIAVTLRLVPGLNRSSWHPQWLGVPCGLFSGTLTGAFGTGGPPAVAYVTTQGFDRLRYAASVQVVLGLGSMVRLPSLAAGGLLTWRTLAVSAAGGLAAVVGAWMGLHVLKRLPEHILNRLVMAMLLLLAILNLMG